MTNVCGPLWIWGPDYKKQNKTPFPSVSCLICLAHGELWLTAVMFCYFYRVVPMDHCFIHIITTLCIIIFFFLYILGPHPWHMEVPRLGVQSVWPLPEPQQCQIWAASATYTTAHGHARSLTHWARPGIEPATSWFLVGFVNHWATTGIPITTLWRRSYHHPHFIIIILLFRAAPEAHGSSQARRLIGAAAAGLRHSHSHTGS